MKRSAMLQGIRRSVSSLVPRRTLASRGHQSQATTQSNGTGERLQDDRKLLRVDAAHKTINTAVGPLPVSPVMDPSFHEARQHHKSPKSRESVRQDKGKFQRQLARNPYAQALASKGRQCAVTHRNLPSFFLQDFTLVQHPETSQPWWVTSSLAGGRSLAGEISGDDVTERPEERETSHQSRRSQGASSAYVLARRALLSSFMTKGSAHYSGHKKLMRMSNSGRLQAALNRAVWREDMDSLVLDQMRKQVTADLLLLAKLCTEQKRKYLHRLATWGEIKEHVHRGCVLWMGPGRPDDSAAEGWTDEPGPFATIDIAGVRRDGKIPVHNMLSLLGQSHLDHILAGSPIFQMGKLLLLERERSVDVQLKLWKLQGFLMEEQGPGAE